MNWNWRAKTHHLHLSSASGFAVVGEEEWQGAMLTKSGTQFSQLAENRGKPLIYIDFREVAPWNWTIPGVGRYGRFGRVGRHLFCRAIQQSFDEGFGGRVGLHALPQSTRFYGEVCGIVPLGEDEEKDDLEYLELEAEHANLNYGQEILAMKTKIDYAGPSEEWLKRTDDLEASCLSVAAAGLAAELGMLDRELNQKIRSSSEPTTASPRPTTANGCSPTREASYTGPAPRERNGMHYDGGPS